MANMHKLTWNTFVPNFRLIGAPIDCVQYNPCSQRCVSAGRRRAEQDRCDCFTGYRLSGDGVTCVDVDECKTGQHTCNRKSEVCDNTRGSFRCLARQSQQARALQLDSFEPEINENVDYAATRLCPVGMRWDANEARCREPNAEVRSASLSALPSLRLTASI